MKCSPKRAETVQPEVTQTPVPFADVKAFLASGAPWPDQPPPVCVETHASFVFLTRNRAWKLKKPVHLVHVDQRSLAAREYLCREELRLNRELSGDVYRSVTPLVWCMDGSLALGGEGQTIDWLVESEKLPAKDMLDHRLVHGADPELAEIEALCDALVTFYSRRPKSADYGAVFHRRLLRDLQTAAAHLREMVSATGVPVPQRVLDFASGKLAECRDQIIQRGCQGLVVEGHGDLRAEHVCLTKPPVVFDRLEIDHGIRLLDPFYEINALGLECALLGAGWIRAVLLVKLSQELASPSRDLISVYGVVALMTRARLAADHFRDTEVAKPEKWRAKTRQSLAAAEQLVLKAGDL